MQVVKDDLPANLPEIGLNGLWRELYYTRDATERVSCRAYALSSVAASDGEW